MELNSFAEMICGEIQERMGHSYCISITTNVKNNALESTGIVFAKDKEDICPTIYINDLFKDYKESGKAVEDVAGEVIRRYEKSLEAVGEICHLDLSLGSCRERIIYRLISREKNKNMLRNMPYIPFLDMAITFHLVAGINKRYVQTIKIDGELQKRWGISVEQLLKLAEENTERILPLEIYDMDEMMASHKELRDREWSEMEKTDMIVVTNQIGIYGAAAILYRDMMQQMAEELECDIYVVPSSVHEMILIPANDEAVYDALSSMIKEINQQFVASNEVLSDRVYIYLREEEKFVSRTSYE